MGGKVVILRCGAAGLFGSEKHMVRSFEMKGGQTRNLGREVLSAKTASKEHLEMPRGGCKTFARYDPEMPVSYTHLTLLTILRV